MKVTKIVMLLAAAGIFAACNSQNSTQSLLKTESDSTSYALGSVQIENFWSQMARFGTADFIDKEKFLTGARDAMNKTPKIANEDAMQIIRQILQQIRMDSTFQMPAISKGEDILNMNDSFGYSLGVNVYESLAGGIEQFQLQESLNMTLLFKGIEDAVRDTAIISAEKAMELVNKMVEKASAKKAEADAAKYESNKNAGEAFLVENKKRPEVKTTESGLQYEVITEGTGAKPTATDKVTVHYHGTLIDGTVFDSSVEGGKPISFALNGVIAGWTEGVQLMKEGAKYKFYIPQELAYGNRPAGQIEPYSALIFEVELLSIEK